MVPATEWELEGAESQSEISFFGGRHLLLINLADYLCGGQDKLALGVHQGSPREQDQCLLSCPHPWVS